MRSRFVGVSGGVLGKAACRGDGDGRTIYAALGETVIVPVAEMSMIYWQNPNQNYGVMTQQKISHATGFLCMAMIQADLSAYNGRTVLAATLNIYNMAAHPAKDFPCYEVWRTWDELQVTYNDRLPATPWQTPGCEGAGDRDSVACDTIQCSVVGWYSWDVKIPVTAWLSGARTNYGVRIWPPILTSAQHEFYTDDNVTPANRPYFELTLA